MKTERAFQALGFTLCHLAPPVGLEHSIWRVRRERTCRAGRAHYPDASIRFEAEIIFEHQDLLERGLFVVEYDAIRRADDAHAGREFFGDRDSE